MPPDSTSRKSCYCIPNKVGTIVFTIIFMIHGVFFLSYMFMPKQFKQSICFLFSFDFQCCENINSYQDVIRRFYTVLGILNGFVIVSGIFLLYGVYKGKPEKALLTFEGLIIVTMLFYVLIYILAAIGYFTDSDCPTQYFVIAAPFIYAILTIGATIVVHNYRTEE